MKRHREYVLFRPSDLTNSTGYAREYINHHAEFNNGTPTHNLPQNLIVELLPGVYHLGGEPLLFPGVDHLDATFSRDSAKVVRAKYCRERDSAKGPVVLDGDLLSPVVRVLDVSAGAGV